MHPCTHAPIAMTMYVLINDKNVYPYVTVLILVNDKLHICREFLGPVIGGGLTHLLTFQDSASVSVQHEVELNFF